MRIRAVYITIFAFIIVQIVNISQLQFSQGKWSSASSLSISVIFLITALLISFRFHARFFIAALGFSLLLVGGTFFSAISDHTGVNSALLPYLPLCILLSGFISGWRMTIATGALCIGLIGVLFFVSASAPTGFIFDPELFVTRNFQRAAQASLACLMTTAVTASLCHAVHGMFASNELSLERIRAAERKRTKFFSSLSHEIRTPLNGIMGMSGLLMKSDLTDAQRQYAQIVTECSDKLLGVMGNVMEMSQIDNERIVLKPNTFNIYELAQNLVEKHAPDLQKDPDLLVGLHIASQVPKLLFADQKRIEMVINHLLSNAVNFTEKGSVNLMLNGNNIDDHTFNLCVYVRDTGLGIKSEDIRHIYEPFHQLDNSLSRSHEGTGLGLSLCKEIIEFMGGQINVISEIGEGSTFYFELPLAIDKKSTIPKLVANNDRFSPEKQTKTSFGKRLKSNG